MKSAAQVREFVRRRCLQEGVLCRANRFRPEDYLRAMCNRVRELAFLEVLNAFDTPNNQKLHMPEVKV